jgi:hypothetical protein
MTDDEIAKEILRCSYEVLYAIADDREPDRLDVETLRRLKEQHPEVWRAVQERVKK